MNPSPTPNPAAGGQRLAMFGKHRLWAEYIDHATSDDGEAQSRLGITGVSSPLKVVKSRMFDWSIKLSGHASEMEAPGESTAKSVVLPTTHLFLARIVDSKGEHCIAGQLTPTRDGTTEGRRTVSFAAWDCGHCPPEAVAPPLFDLLSQYAQPLVAAATREDLFASLDAFASAARAIPPASGLLPAERLALADTPQLGPDRAGLIRTIHELLVELKLARDPVKGAWHSNASMPHVRVPVIGGMPESAGASLIAHASLLRKICGPDADSLLVVPLKGDWIDLFVGPCKASDIAAIGIGRGGKGAMTAERGRTPPTDETAQIRGMLDAWLKESPLPTVHEPASKPGSMSALEGKVAAAVKAVPRPTVAPKPTPSPAVEAPRPAAADEPRRGPSAVVLAGLGATLVAATAVGWWALQNKGKGSDNDGNGQKHVDTTIKPGTDKPVTDTPPKPRDEGKVELSASSRESLVEFGQFLNDLDAIKFPDGSEQSQRSFKSKLKESHDYVKVRLHENLEVNFDATGIESGRMDVLQSLASAINRLVPAADMDDLPKDFADQLKGQLPARVDADAWKSLISGKEVQDKVKEQFAAIDRWKVLRQCAAHAEKVAKDPSMKTAATAAFKAAIEGADPLVFDAWKSETDKAVSQVRAMLDAEQAAADLATKIETAFRTGPQPLKVNEPAFNDLAKLPATDYPKILQLVKEFKDALNDPAKARTLWEKDVPAAVEPPATSKDDALVEAIMPRLRGTLFLELLKTLPAADVTQPLVAKSVDGMLKSPNWADAITTRVSERLGAAVASNDAGATAVWVHLLSQAPDTIRSGYPNWVRANLLINALRARPNGAPGADQDPLARELEPLLTELEAKSPGGGVKAQLELLQQYLKPPEAEPNVGEAISAAIGSNGVCRLEVNPAGPDAVAVVKINGVAVTFIPARSGQSIRYVAATETTVELARALMMALPADRRTALQARMNDDGGKTRPLQTYEMLDEGGKDDAGQPYGKLPGLRKGTLGPTISGDLPQEIAEGPLGLKAGSELQYPFNYVSFEDAQVLAAVCGMELPEVSWYSAASPSEISNLRDKTFHEEYYTKVQELAKKPPVVFRRQPYAPSNLRSHASDSVLFSGQSKVKVTDDAGFAVHSDVPDEIAFFAPAGPLSEAIPAFRRGNVAEFAISPDRTTWIAGSSALSDPTGTDPIELGENRRGKGFSDVGFRLSFKVELKPQAAPRPDLSQLNYVSEPGKTSGPGK
jgi:hypothetical protein